MGRGGRSRSGSGGFVSFIFKVLATNPPMALIVGAIFCVFLYSITSNINLLEFAKTFLFWGAALQILWLLFKLAMHSPTSRGGRIR